MKKSDLKQLIKEVIEEVQLESKLTASEKKKISNEMHKYKELGGTVKVPKLGVALNKIQMALDAAGFQLDMVSGDMLMGNKGNRLLPFRRKSTSDDPYSEGSAIENSRINFTWEITDARANAPLLVGNQSYEVISYVT